ncbi:MAG: hypothetical protein AAFQ98_19035, partial [Bacteroidota bacterium]
LEGDVVKSVASEKLIDDFQQAVDQGAGKYPTLPSLSIADQFALSVYQKILLQINYIQCSSNAALLPYIFSQMVEGTKISSLGVTIAELGGWRTKEGGFALGSTKMGGVWGQNQNILVRSFENATFKNHTDFTIAQGLLSPLAKYVYEHDLKLSSTQTDRIIFFKTKMTCYRYKLEQVWADKNVGETFKEYLQKVASDGASGKSNATQTADLSFLNSVGFDEHSMPYKLFIGKSGVLRRLGQVISFGQFFNNTKSAEERAKFIVDCFIFFRILELHLGTPWPASLPYSPNRAERVLYALVDAFVTVTMTKVNSSENGHRLSDTTNKTFKTASGSVAAFEKIIPHKELLACSPVRAFFTPITEEVFHPTSGSSMGNTKRKDFDEILTRLLPQDADQVMCDGKNTMPAQVSLLEKFYLSIPAFANGNTDTTIYIENIKNSLPTDQADPANSIAPQSKDLTHITLKAPTQYKKYCERLLNYSNALATLKNAFEPVWEEDTTGDNHSALRDQLERANKKNIAVIEKAFWPNQKGNSPTAEYVQWMLNRADLNSSKKQYQYVEQLAAEYQVSRGHTVDPGTSPLPSSLEAFRLQQMAMQLLINDQEDPKVAMKLMQDSMKEMFQLIGTLGTEIQQLKQS